MHTIFGEVEDSESQKVVDKIVNVKTRENDLPKKKIKIKSVSVSYR